MFNKIRTKVDVSNEKFISFFKLILNKSYKILYYEELSVQNSLIAYQG